MVTYWEENNYKCGSLEIMDFIRDNKDINDIYFFDGFHSQPFYSHIHRNITMDFPSYNGYERANNYGDWVSFETDPESFIDTKKNYEWVVTLLPESKEEYIHKYINKYWKKEKFIYNGLQPEGWKNYHIFRKRKN